VNASMLLHAHQTVMPMTTNLEPIRFDSTELVPTMNIVRSWTNGLPVFKNQRMLLRELVKTDAATLLSVLRTEEVARFISPPPTTPAGFEKFIQWAIGERQAGRQMTFGMVPEGHDRAVGLVQVRATTPDFSVAEWGFAVGSPFWGTGLFLASARTTIDFAFQRTGVNRLEARAAVENGRGNAALRKLGAVREMVLRGSFLKDGRYLDQNMWSIVASDWNRLNPAPFCTIH
jgi:[ribosomal protein S5]-alanine N-acetyltransferase